MLHILRNLVAKLKFSFRRLQRKCSAFLTISTSAQSGTFGRFWGPGTYPRAKQWPPPGPDVEPRPVPAPAVLSAPCPAARCSSGRTPAARCPSAPGRRPPPPPPPPPSLPRPSPPTTSSHQPGRTPDDPACLPLTCVPSFGFAAWAWSDQKSGKRSCREHKEAHRKRNGKFETRWAA